MEQKTIEDALNVLANASASYVGTRKDHEIIVEALNVLRKAASPAAEASAATESESAAS